MYAQNLRFTVKTQLLDLTQIEKDNWQITMSLPYHVHLTSITLDFKIENSFFKCKMDIKMKIFLLQEQTTQNSAKSSQNTGVSPSIY
jgi:hypothetical protein